MHCELLVPALFAAPAEARLPALELLLARGRGSGGEAATPARWLLESFGHEDDDVPAGALTVAAEGAAPGVGLWMRADPIHLRLMRDRLILVPSAAFAVSRAEADALCEALNQHFSGVLRVEAPHPERWCAQIQDAAGIDTACPLELAGRDVDLSQQRGTGRWQALLNEVQMLLHAHPVNEAREARGEPTINSLWLWGAGRAPKVDPERWHGVVADEPLARGLARLGGVRHRPLPESAPAWLERAPQEGRHLVVLDNLRAPYALGESAAYSETLDGLEKRWFAPLLAALRSERIGMVSIHVPETGAAFETMRADLRRFWRRPKALEHYT
jgi:hypothetical protein